MVYGPVRRMILRIARIVVGNDLVSRLNHVPKNGTLETWEELALDI